MRRLLLPTLLAAAAAAGAAGTYAVYGAGDEEPVGDDGPSVTAVVERGTITATEAWTGTLGHGAVTTVEAGAGGTVTRVPTAGAMLEFGDALIHIDERPVTLLQGVIPMYRDLGPGDSGADVEQLERNLRALGYEGITVDDDYTWYTGDLVRQWQEDLGVEESGTVEAGSVVFQPEAMRLERLHVDVGGRVQSGEAIADLTGGRPVASLEIDVDDRDLAEVGSEVVVDLPGGQAVPGEVARIEVVEADAEGSEDAEPVAEVDVALGEEVPEDLIGAPVEVVVTVEERSDVLLVPVAALLALSEGGYGLEVFDGDASSIVAVDTGLFAEGTVEVSGDGLAEGAVVGVAGR